MQSSPPFRRGAAWMWGGTALLASLAPGAALAAPPGGAAPGPEWGVPFAGVLLSIALMPVLAPHFWHRRMGAVAAGWTLALVLPLAVMQGVGVAGAAVWHAILLEYLPFVTLLLALFTVGGGILLEGGPWGTPRGNTLLLALGTMLAGVMGTTGVSMVLIHPLLRANSHRRRRVHIVVFFILLCANVGGATTPLGDPPLYIGFLHGVPFFWPLRNLTAPMLVVAVPLLAAFWLLDRHLAARDPQPARVQRIRVRGRPNVALIGVVVATVLAQGMWHPGTAQILGQAIELERLGGMAVFVAVAAVSLLVTPAAVREGNLFTWAPMAEVAKLFAAIFITIGPVLAMLAAGREGPLAPLLALMTDAGGRPIPLAYFWLAGTLSAFLDNAPTYLVFFQLAGNDPALLTGELSGTLRAIAAGAVFFGALTYIGNAPNLMVRTIAAHRSVRMPGFFGYMAWSCAIMLPVFVLLTLIFFV
ncbi:sodium:proton antiporter [Limobrevibacterium gyesilva]|uniref:Sodium:proton antiporter n=1 Tax=Limobrevibacterium gyesilva TaxID=2991712 RepID=A0AA41YT76_9PROT|nr:sodium:proton antiporter [Limobrevibacterium gyesilva]MCW3475017.1 sodium:proton antiporter [Limobrevibacterium gyesilva]